MKALHQLPAVFAFFPFFLLFSFISLSTGHEADNWVNRNDLMTDIRGTVCGESGEPLAGATVYFRDPRRILDPEYRPVTATTDAEGRFSLKYDTVDAFRHPIFAVSPDGEHHGFYSFLCGWEMGQWGSENRVSWEDMPRDRTGKVLHGIQMSQETLREIRITVHPVTVAEGKVVDEAGQPVAGVCVGTRYLLGGGHFDFTLTRTDSAGLYKLPVPAGKKPDAIYAVHRELGGFFSPMAGGNSNPLNIHTPELVLTIKKYPTQVKFTDHDTGKPRTDYGVYPRQVNYQLEHSDTPFYGLPDADGVITIPWFPATQHWVPFDPESMVRAGEEYRERTADETKIAVKNRPTKVYGRVHYPDGTPAAGIRVLYFESLYEPSSGRTSTEVYSQTWTDARGHYEADMFWGTSHDHFRIYVLPEVDGWVAAELPVKDFPANGVPVRFDVGLRKPTIVRGTVTINHMQQGKSPAAGIRISVTGCMEKWWQSSGISRRTDTWIQTTDEKGEYRFELGPGFYSLQGDDGRIYQNFLNIDSQEEIIFDAQTVRNDLKGTVFDASQGRKPAAGVSVGHPKFHKTLDFGKPFSAEQVPVAVTDAHGRFSFKDSTRSDMFFLARDKEKKRYGLIFLPEPKAEIEIEIAPLLERSGHLVREEDGTPLAGYEYLLQAVRINENVDRANPQRYWRMELPEIKGVTDSDGHFKTTSLIHGVYYSLRIKSKDPDGLPVSYGYDAEPEVRLFRADEAESQDMGEIRVPETVYLPGGGTMRIATMIGTDFDQKFSQAQRLAKKNNQRIIILFTPTNFAPHHLFLTLFYDDPDVRKFSRHFQLLIGENRRFNGYDEEKFAGIAKKLGIRPEDVPEPTLCVFDAEGKLLEKVPFESLRQPPAENRRSDKTDPEKFIEILKRNLPQGKEK